MSSQYASKAWAAFCEIVPGSSHLQLLHLGQIASAPKEPLFLPVHFTRWFVRTEKLHTKCLARGELQLLLATAALFPLTTTANLSVALRSSKFRLSEFLQI